MSIFVEKTIQWRGGNGTTSTTDICVYKNMDKFLIVATESPRNKGLSVTNGAEYLWEFVLADLKLRRDDCIFVESYQHEAPTYDQVFLGKEVKWLNISNFDNFLEDFLYVPNKTRIESIQ